MREGDVASGERKRAKRGNRDRSQWKLSRLKAPVSYRIIHPYFHAQHIRVKFFFLTAVQKEEKILKLGSG